VCRALRGLRDAVTCSSDIRFLFVYTKGASVGVTKEQFNHWLMFEFKASGGKRNMHNWLQCNIHGMNRTATTETTVRVVKLQQHNDADSSTKLYRKLHFLLSTSTVQIIHKLSSHSAVSHLKSTSSYTWKCKWITFGLRTVTKLCAELAVCASARQELQVWPKHLRYD
jgi:hypothetical protein